jgi:hypothetical protein
MGGRNESSPGSYCEELKNCRPVFTSKSAVSKPKKDRLTVKQAVRVTCRLIKETDNLTQCVGRD